MKGFRVFVFSSRIDHILLPHCSKNIPAILPLIGVFHLFRVSKKHLFFDFYLVLLGCRVPIPVTKRLHGPYQHKLNGNERTLQHSHTFCLVHACHSQCGVRELVSGTMDTIRVIITTAEKYLRRFAIV